MNDLFGIVPPTSVPTKTPRAGRNAYPADPGSGPAGIRCKDCRHIRLEAGASRVYPKCELNRGRWTHGRATDIRRTMPACRLFEAKGEG